MGTEIVLAIIGAVVSGIAGVWKAIQWFIERRDEQQKKVFEQRDKDKAQIKADITELKKDVRNISAIVLKCDNPDCQAKKMLAEYWEKKETA